MGFAKRLTIAALAVWYLTTSASAGYASGHINVQKAKNPTKLEETVACDEGTKVPDDTLLQMVNGLDYLKFIELVDNNQYAGVAEQYKSQIQKISRYNLNLLSKEDRHKVAQVNNSLGTISHKEGMYEQAIEFYEKATELNPTFSAFYRNLGSAYKDLGKQTGNKEYFDKAIEAYNTCLEYEPEGSSRAKRVQRAINSINSKYLPQLISLKP